MTARPLPAIRRQERPRGPRRSDSQRVALADDRRHHALRAVPKLVFFQVQRALGALTFVVFGLRPCTSCGRQQVQLVALCICRVFVH